MIHFDIVIPHYNVPATEQIAADCVRSIRQYSQDYRLIWVQNGGEVPNTIAVELMQMPAVLMLTNQSNEGFVKAANRGLKEVTAPYTVLMNNDTLAVANWLGLLSAPILGQIVMSGPRTTTLESWQGHAPPGTGIRILPRNAMLAFFCVMFKSSIFQEVGYLDEDFGVGFGDDDNYCARVHSKGYRMCLVPNLVIPHYHRTTFRAIYSREDIKRMQDAALKLHFDKLGHGA